MSEFSPRDFLKVSGIGLAAFVAGTLRIPKISSGTEERNFYVDWIPFLSPVIAKTFIDAQNPYQSWQRAPYNDPFSDLIPYTYQITGEFAKNDQNQIILKIMIPKPDTLMLYPDVYNPSILFFTNLESRTIPCAMDARVLASAASLSEGSKKVEILLAKKVFMTHDKLFQISRYIEDNNIPISAKLRIEPGQIQEDPAEVPPFDPDKPQMASLNIQDYLYLPPKYYIRITEVGRVSYYSSEQFDKESTSTS